MKLSLLFRYHEDGTKKLNTCSSIILCMVYFKPEHENLVIYRSYITIFTHHKNAQSTRPYSLCLLTWRTSPLARGGEFPSTLVPGLLTTAPPFTSSPTPSHPTHRSSYNVYINDINNTQPFSSGTSITR
jgi:hypothetical protein